MVRSMSQGNFDVGLILSMFELTRKADVASRRLRFDLHPDLLLHRRLKLQAMQYHILRIMYRCGPLSAFNDGQTNAKAYTAGKKRQRKQADTLTQKKSTSTTADGIQRRAVREHLLEVVGVDNVCRTIRSALGMEPAMASLHAHQSARRSV